MGESEVGFMTMIYRKVRHNGDECYAYCGAMEGDRYTEKCACYNPESMCRNCKYISGKVIEEEREEDE